MDAPQQILYNFQIKRFEVFKAQDSEDGDFDFVFDIAGKKLYAHKFTLCPISSTFKSMLSDRWTKPGEPIKIEGYTFNDFKEFLKFIYAGQCQLTDANISAIVDMAEFYGIQELKDVCEKHLSGMLNLANVHQMVELFWKYSLKKFKKSLDRFITKNFITFFKSDRFQRLQKIKEMVKAYQETWSQEEFFEGIYKWAENRAFENQKLDQTLNEAVKTELSEILPLIKFEIMDSVFFRKFVAKKSFLFSADKWNDILWARKTRLFVKVIDENGKIMKGEIQCDDTETVSSAIKFVKDICCREVLSDYFDWSTYKPIKPSTPSKLTINDIIEWYLVADKHGDLAIMRTDEIEESDYLLSQMSAEVNLKCLTNVKLKLFLMHDFLFFSCYILILFK